MSYLFCRLSDPWLHTQHHSLDKDQQTHQNEPERRRSSGLSGRLSLFDALDLEYALFRAAARGSVGPYSLTGSVHKLTFTQSLAFPNLARNMATKRRCSPTQDTARPLNPNESGLNTCAKIATALVLVAISFLVFFIVFKYVKTWGLLVQDQTGPVPPTSATNVYTTAIVNSLTNRTLSGFRKFWPIGQDTNPIDKT